MFKKLSPKSDASHDLTVTVRFLDDSDPLHIKIQKNHSGQWLLDKVCSELNLVEQDYFGLRYVDGERQRHWVDPLKTVYKQLKNVSQMVVCFRVKFYPDDPMKLQEEVTRYSLFLQLRRDLHHGRLLCSTTDSNNLAAYIIQSEVGDYHEEDCKPGYVSKFKMLPRQTITDEEKIMAIHKTLTGLVPSEAEEQFLKKACTLDTYGVDPHQVQDSKGVSMYLGVTHLGIVTFHSNKRNGLYKWEQVSKLAFDSKTFVVHVDEDEKKLQVGYKCPTYAACKHLWKCAVEQQAFFTLDRSSEAKKVVSGGGLFRRSSKYRFSGRCQSEVFSYSSNHKRDTIDFTRSPSSTLQRRFSQKRPVKPHIIINRAESDEIFPKDVVENGISEESTDQSQDGSSAVVEAIQALSDEPTEAEPAAAETTGEVKTDEAPEDTAEADDTPPEVAPVANHIGETDVATETEVVGDAKVEEIVTATETIVESAVADTTEEKPGPSGDDKQPLIENVFRRELYSEDPETNVIREAPPVYPILVMFLLFLTALVVVVMDDRIDIAFLREVRKSDVLANARFQYYNPVRDYVGRQLQSLTGSGS